LGKTKVIAVDKTGTITEGKPEVTDILTFGEISEKDFLTIAASMEHKSEHPLAKAIVQKAKQEGVDLDQTTNFESVVGNGISVSINEKKYFAGNYDFVSKIVDVQEDILQIAETLANNGKTPLFFVEVNKILGIIAVADTIKNDSSEAIAELNRLGMKLVMITGDNKKTAMAIAKKVGIKNIFSGILPQQKAEKVNELMLEGYTAMVGDGINDAPSLMAANVGIAIGAGADIAVDAADVVLMKNSLMDVVYAVRLSRAALRIIHQNLFWAFVYNIIGIPLATGVFISAFGWQLNPMFAALAMSLSSFSVVTNALRLNYINIKNKKERKSKMNAKLTIQIEGMMCPHCEANIKNTLEAMENVVAVEVSHKAGVAVIETNSEIDDDIIKKAIENKGYKVITIK
jgi:Cu2+-exporting ATPase